MFPQLANGEWGIHEMVVLPAPSLSLSLSLSLHFATKLHCTALQEAGAQMPRPVYLAYHLLT